MAITSGLSCNEFINTMWHTVNFFAGISMSAWRHVLQIVFVFSNYVDANRESSETNNLQGESADCRPAAAPGVVPRRASRRRLTSSGDNSFIVSFLSRR